MGRKVLAAVAKLQQRPQVAADTATSRGVLGACRMLLGQSTSVTCPPAARSRRGVRV